MTNGRIRTWINSANNNPRMLELIFGFLVIALGIAVRVNFVTGSVYPLNDGGFFYRMTEELVNNNFLLPKYTLYNHSEIPFAYPPLAFYLVGITHRISGISLLSLFKYFPLIISCLTIPVYYLLTERFFESKIYRLLAVYLFATLPRSFEWFVMGGGVTRSLGFFFAILSIYFVWEVFQENRISVKIIWVTTFSALTILSHPVTSLFLLFSVIVIFIYHYPVKIKLVLGLAVLIIIATSPWWVTILKYHGISPFLEASNTGHMNWFEIKNLITQKYGYENPYFLSIVSVLAIFGLFSERKKISINLGILCVLGYVVIPRGGVDLLTLYLPLLATIGFQLVTEPWNKESFAGGGNKFPSEIESINTRTLLVFIFVYVLLGAYTYKFVYNKAELRLNESNFLAMEYLRDNTRETDTVLLIPQSAENRYWWNDFISEWLPALSERESITTVQGYEWKPNEFEERILLYTSLRNCNAEYDCIKMWQRDYKMNPDYIYLDDLTILKNLSEDILDSMSYSITFENENVMILENINR
jgi:hypothetical protein